LEEKKGIHVEPYEKLRDMVYLHQLAVEQRVVGLVRVDEASVVLPQVATVLIWFFNSIVGDIDERENLFNVVVLVHVVASIFYVATVVNHLLV
jgi:hypothetical protein